MCTIMRLPDALYNWQAILVRVCCHHIIDGVGTYYSSHPYVVEDSYADVCLCFSFCDMERKM